ncbi:MAG: hypothetical protein ABIG44_14370 [Planctomycetota bacterium]
MSGLFRALMIIGLARLLLLPAVAGATPPAEEEEPGLDSDSCASVFQLVKRFDFDERPLGNYNDTPMYWEHLSGPGLPRYSAGSFDDQDGHDSAPSFRMDLQGGSICYQYNYGDISVLPDADYLVSGYVRPVGLDHARAFIQAYLVDRFGNRIPDSDRLSELTSSQVLTDPITPKYGSLGGGMNSSSPEVDFEDEPWQRLEISLTGDHPDAHGLRLCLWVLQEQAWHSRDENAIDPILRQDVQALVWFDDLAIYRVPRMRLRISSPGGIVLPDEPAEFLLDMYNSTQQTLRSELQVVDASGNIVHCERQDVLAHNSIPNRAPLPALDPGLYTAQLRLHGNDENLMYKAIRFAVLPRLAVSCNPAMDLGIDLGPWCSSEVADAVALTAELRCGSAKVGVPMIGALDTAPKIEYFDQIRELATSLSGQRVHTTGVMLSASAASNIEAGESTWDMLTLDSHYGELIGPCLAHLGGVITRWQLGYECREAGINSGWNPDALQVLRAHISRSVTVPELAVPRTVFSPETNADPGAGGPDAVSLWVPREVPTHELPRQLEFLADIQDFAEDDQQSWHQAANERWLMLESSRAGVIPERRLADLARRVVLTKTLGPERIYVPAPFELSANGGSAAWQPTDEFIVLRTLFTYLSGKHAIAAMPLPEHDGLAIFFQGMDSACVVLWTWRDEAVAEPVELYLGPRPTVTDLWGQSREIEVVDGRTRIALSPMPLIVDDIDAPLALLQASFSVEPHFIQLHEPRSQPVLSLTNTYAQPMTGLIEFRLPELWRLNPAQVSFALEPGESLEHPLAFEMPPLTLSMPRHIGIRVSLSIPVSEVLEFDVPLQVGLRDIRVWVETHWMATDLIVEQSVRNLSDQSVDFTAYCRAPERARLERAFLNVGPGQFQTQTYVYPQAHDLAGTALRLGIREINGPRALDQFVEIPN